MMVKFINQTTGGVMWVHESRVEEYKAAGHRPAAEIDATAVKEDMTYSEEEITPKEKTIHEEKTAHEEETTPEAETVPEEKPASEEAKPTGGRESKKGE